MIILNKILKKIKGILAPQVVSLKCANPKGNVLFSYLKDSVKLKEDDFELEFHSNKWESREIARIFHSLGYNVDVIDWNNENFIARKNYDVFFDIHQNLSRVKVRDSCVKILHITGSYPKYSNKKEQARIAALNERRNSNIVARRQADEKTFDKSLENADFATLIGNQHTLDTFPEKFKNKIHRVLVTSSKISVIKSKGNYLSNEREFLWFSGAGAVHKGLDLLLEFFYKHPELTLNVVGPIDKEIDFIKEYQKELNSHNVKVLGYLSPSSKEFEQVLKRCFCFIYPSCSEGISTAALTALSAGLYPIISVDTGFDLPDGCGIYLKDCTEEEIEESIKKVTVLGDEDIIKQIMSVQQKALSFSRENFKESFLGVLKFRGL